MKKVVIAALLFVLIVAPYSYSNDNKWGIEIELSKQTYVLHEPIWLDITLTNNTSDTLRTHGLSTPNYLQFVIDIKDSNGKLIEYTGPAFSLAGGPGDLFLEAGEQDYGSFNLPDLYGSRDTNSSYSVISGKFSSVPKGRYTVRVHFEKDSSNVLSIDIVEPSGEEKEILELIAKAINVWDRDNAEPSSQIFQEVVDRFPGSAFAEKCYYFSRVYSQNIWERLRQGTYDFRVLGSEMLMAYPNSGNARAWLLGGTNKMVDKSKLELVNKLIKDNPNTRCSKFAKLLQKRMLKTLNTKEEE